MRERVSKPKLNFWQIWNMSFGFLGIQFGFALQNANTSRIFETLGADVDQIPILWIAAPMTGLIVQPIIGYWSDRTWSAKWGRRRPFFLIGAILASIALFIMPNSPVLWIAAGTLWIMDASINVTMEPFRAFVGDMLPSSQRTMGFATQSFFIGVGAVIASLLPYLLSTYFNVANTAAEGIIPDSVKWSFYIGGILFLLAVLWTVFNTKEYSPEQLKSFEPEKTNSFQPQRELTEIARITKSKIQNSTGISTLLIGLLGLILIFYYNLAKETYLLAFMLIVVGFLWLISSSKIRKSENQSDFTQIMTDLLEMPKTMKQLAWVQFFSWFGLFSMWIYTTSAITSHIYGTSDPMSELYNQGADRVGYFFAVYNGVAALVAFLLPAIAKYIGRKYTHALCLTLGGLGLISIFFISTVEKLWFPMIGIGIAWASILSLPYAMLSGVLPSDKMGYYMGVFNFFIVIPQLIAATILGSIVSTFFNNEAIYALVLGGAIMLLGALFSLFVNDADDVALIHK